jgi:hypothetical protein
LLPSLLRQAFQGTVGLNLPCRKPGCSFILTGNCCAQFCVWGGGYEGVGVPLGDMQPDFAAQTHLNCFFDLLRAVGTEGPLGVMAFNALRPLLCKALTTGLHGKYIHVVWKLTCTIRSSVSDEANFPTSLSYLQILLLIF